MHDRYIDSARRSSWSIYEMAIMPDLLDPRGIPDIYV